jgi:DNA-binding response OmpR family regulator
VRLAVIVTHVARILLIEDNESIRTVLRENLVHSGHTVIEACDGREGLALFRQTGADLVVTDIVMPEKEGLEVLIELRNSQPRVKVIVMSGAGLGGVTDYLATARLLGAAKVLRKPFATSVLLAAIDEVLSVDRTRE